MNVLFLSSWFPNRTAPYNGDFVERHALAVSELCTTSVVHVIPDDDPACPLLEITELRRGNLYEVIIYFRRFTGWLKPVNRIVNLFRYAIGYYKGYRKIRTIQGKPEIIHANILYPISAVAWMISRLTGIPYIISEHWTGFLTSKDAQIKIGAFVHFTVNNAFALVPVTINLQQALIRHGFYNQYRIVPNVVDTDLFALQKPANARLKHFIHVSSMKEHQKNISGILRSLGRLTKIRSDFAFTFVGDDQPFQAELASTLGLLPHRVVFKGMRSNQEVAELMQESDVLVLFSAFENLPCVLLEALSCGLPVISSDTGGIKEWIKEDHGILVNPGDEDSLLNALISMLDYSGKYDSHKLRAYAIEHFSKKIIARQFLEIYRQALNHQ
jgi:glycosyltransferase involved in cell wall biosynthesis